MNCFRCLLVVLATLTMVSCDEKGDHFTAEDIEVIDGYALSAGTSTVFFNSAVAYDQPADWVSGVYDTRFNRGSIVVTDYMTM